MAATDNERREHLFSLRGGGSSSSPSESDGLERYDSPERSESIDLRIVEGILERIEGRIETLTIITGIVEDRLEELENRFEEVEDMLIEIEASTAVSEEALERLELAQEQNRNARHWSGRSVPAWR